jgi:hypothetical protein
MTVWGFALGIVCMSSLRCYTQKKICLMKNHGETIWRNIMKNFIEYKYENVHIFEMNASMVEMSKEIDVPRVWDISLVHVA